MRYEDLVEAPRSELQRIGEFLQLEKEIPFQASSEWTIHGETQNIANLNAKSIARLSAEDLQQIDNVISEELMEKFGYMRTGSVGVAAGLDG